MERRPRPRGAVEYAGTRVRRYGNMGEGPSPDRRRGADTTGVMSSSSRDFDRWVPCGGPLLAIGLSLAATLSGCLMPAPADYVPVGNVWPRLDSLYPDPAASVLQQGPGCDDIAFQARVVDPDEGETIFWRVFVDYQVRAAKQLRDGQAQNDPDPAKGVRITFTTDQTTPWVPGDTPHVVELFVADRPFMGPDGRAVDTTRYPDAAWVDLFWTVQVSQCSP